MCGVHRIIILVVEAVSLTAAAIILNIKLFGPWRSECMDVHTVAYYIRLLNYE